MMLKKFLIITVLVFLVLCGCSNNHDEVKEETKNETVSVDEKLFDVTITLPNSFFESFDSTAEDYINAMTEEEKSNFKKVEKNSDNSVSITMSKSQHKELLSQISSGIDESLQEMVDSNEYSVDSIEHDGEYKLFKVYLSSKEASLTDSFLVYAFAMFGGIYQVFNGVDSTNVKVKYINVDGEEIFDWDSSQLED